VHSLSTVKLYLSLSLCLFLFFVDLDLTVQHRAVDKSVRGTLSAGSWNGLNTEPSNDASLTHRMHVFRVRLLHFVNSFHDYIMTRVNRDLIVGLLLCYLNAVVRPILQH